MNEEQTMLYFYVGRNIILLNEIKLRLAEIILFKKFKPELSDDELSKLNPLIKSGYNFTVDGFINLWKESGLLSKFEEWNRISNDNITVKQLKYIYNNVNIHKHAIACSAIPYFVSDFENNERFVDNSLYYITKDKKQHGFLTIKNLHDINALLNSLLSLVLRMGKQDLDGYLSIRNNR
jgi:hypothetical protein